MNYLLFAADANDIVAISFIVALVLFVTALVVFLVLTKVGKKEVNRIREGKCPFSGKNFVVKTERDERKTIKKHVSYNPELVFRRAEDDTVRAKIEDTCSYETDEIIDGDVEESWSEYDFGYSLKFAYTTDKKYRKNPDYVNDKIEYTVEKYTYTVNDYGKLGALKRYRLKKACKKASFTHRYLE